MTKYTSEQMALIRADYESGIKPKEIGIRYGIPAGTIASWASRGKWIPTEGNNVKEQEPIVEFQELIDKRSELTSEQAEVVRKYAELVLEVRKLNSKVQELTNENLQLGNRVQELISENQKLISEHNSLSDQPPHKQQRGHNERNAGRKITLEYDVLTREINSLYSQSTPEGKRVYSQRSIADMLGVSIGTVNKVLQESKRGIAE